MAKSGGKKALRKSPYFQIPKEKGGLFCSICYLAAFSLGCLGAFPPPFGAAFPLALAAAAASFSASSSSPSGIACDSFNSWNMAKTSGTDLTPITELLRSLTLTVPSAASFSPTTKMKLNCASCPSRTFFCMVLPEVSTSTKNPALRTAAPTACAYPFTVSLTGTTKHCLGLNQNGHFPPKCSISTAAMRSTDPSMARWMMMGFSYPCSF
mmetsp:Transcript_24873/g.49743  ORF Transcript_24873/g.49743 Transcript_24873/m.49743 type:complete len:210 (+) Transcript_24873:129-758(+)